MLTLIRSPVIFTLIIVFCNHIIKKQTFMKNLFYISFICIISFTLLGCKHIELTIPEGTPTVSLDFFSQYGVVHNAMLSYVDKNIDINKRCKTKEDALDYLVDIESKYAEDLSLPDSDQRLIKELLPVYKHLFIKENINLSPFTRVNVEEDSNCYTTEDIINSINASFDRGEIDLFEKQSLTSLMNWCEDNVLGKLTNDSFELKFTSLIKQWEEHYSNTDFSSMVDKNGNFKNDLEEFPTGAISGVVLNISRSSLQYWDTPETRSVVGTIVVQDIVGAIIGGVSGGVGSAVIGGEWNWGSVAWGAGVGAITGSTGVVGKVSKWIVSLF